MSSGCVSIWAIALQRRERDGSQKNAWARKKDCDRIWPVRASKGGADGEKGGEGESVNRGKRSRISVGKWSKKEERRRRTGRADSAEQMKRD